MKLFNKWDFGNIQVNDPGLKDYIKLEPILVPRTCGRTAHGQRIYVQKTNIVERLMNKIMIPGHKGKKHKLTSYRITGKALKAYSIVKSAFEIIEKELNKNPLEVFVKALENAAPREEVTSIEYGGARYSKAVDISPQRRIDIALKFMVQGSYGKSFNTKIKFEKALANEITNAYKMDQASNAISKKLELERQADASR